MEAVRSYWLECHSTRIEKRGKPKDIEIITEYSIHVSPDSGPLTKQHLSTLPGDQSDRLYQFISDLDYSVDTVPRAGPVQRAQSTESTESVEERPFGERFAFTAHYTDELSVRTKHSEIYSGVVERLVHLQQLVELHLLECPLTEESEYLIQFGPVYNLKVLKLEKLNIRRLHPSIGRLCSLQDLSLSYNRLTDLPLTIRLLRNLRHLNITGNPFSRLPGAVYHLHLDSISGLNDCPLNKDISTGWQIRNQDIWWRAPLVSPEPREKVDTLQECSIQAAVGMDCWQLQLTERFTQRLTEMAESQGLCENCLKSVRKLTIEHESLGYTIHARLAVFCGVRDVPFRFTACSRCCLDLTVGKLLRVNDTRKKMDDFTKLPCCEYGLEFVQDLEEYRRQRALSLLPVTYNRSTYNPRNSSDSNSKCLLS